MAVQQETLSINQRLVHAVDLHKNGQPALAAERYREILQEAPLEPTANHNLGSIELEQHNVAASLPLFKTALEAAPEQSIYWTSYINALMAAEHYHDAEMVLEYGLQAGLAGADIDALAATLAAKMQALATPGEAVELELVALFEAQRYTEIENKILGLIHQYPRWLTGWKMLSDTFLIQDKDARLPALRALELNEQDAKEHCYYGLILKKQGDLKGAAHAFEQAIRLNPDYTAAYNNLGVVKKDMGDVAGGVVCYRQALKLNPSYADCYSNLLFCLSHDADTDALALYKAHVQFGKQYEQPLKKHWQPHSNDKTPDRALRVGFVSAAFREHSLVYFIEPLLPFLSTSRNLTLYAYATSAIEDSTTQRVKRGFRYWQQVDNFSNEALAAKIREDQIDILVDLDGHTSDNRLLAFALKPAPIQVSWLGYLSTTGLTAMDYYLADSYLVPPHAFDAQFTEQLVQLPANAPFMPSDVAPEINALPALSNGYVTFACFNRPNKITASAVKLWAQLMDAVPHSKMLLGAMPHDGSYDALISWFNDAGIASERLIFRPRSFMKNYLKLHQEVDICLDTFPSNGVTTTCHAVSMGVPTLCLNGQSLTSRAAMAVMKHVGLDDFVAEDAADFVKKGVYWAEHLQSLSDVRLSLRERFDASALAKPEMLADALEQAFRRMWQTWCNALPAAGFEIKAEHTQVNKKNEIIYVTQPLLPDLKDFVPYLEKIWDNKLLTNGGPFHQQLEKALCEYLGVNHIALFTNGTIALLTALQALRISGEVITTPYSFVATAHSLLWNGIKPVFVDIDPVTLNMDASKIAAAITPNTTAIMPVHCYGHPCEVDKIQKIADDYNLKVIYDAAHAFGVQHQGTSLLNYGDLSVLSFHATKVFNTFEGGAIICPDAKTKQRIDHLKNFGFVDEVTVVAAGINGKMSEINAAFGLLQLKGVDAAFQKRKLVDAHYRSALAGVTGIDCLQNAGEQVANYSYFPILVKPNYPLSRDALYHKLRDGGVYARRYFYPLISDFPMYRGMPSAAKDNLPVASLAASEVICLPIFPELTVEKLHYIIDLIKG